MYLTGPKKRKKGVLEGIELRGERASVWENCRAQGV